MSHDLKSQEGNRVPNVVFRARRGDEWLDISSHELFTGKTVVVFSLPGAYTPTCSSSHVPRYNELADTLKANGVDDIVCVSVNDGFVMEAWQKEQRADKIRFIPDGNGEFTEAMGMLVNKSDLGFGQRSWRYSMLVRDGLIEKMFIEPQKPGDPFEVSDADTMLKYLNPDAKGPEFITLFTKPGCPHCARAKTLLEARGLGYEEVVLENEITTRTLRAVANASTTPQVFMNGRLIGGADDLETHFANA